MTTSRCDTCKFWRPSSTTTVTGDCRNMSPVSIMIDILPRDSVLPEAEARKAIWPSTEYTDWCGDYTPVEEWETANEEA